MASCFEISTFMESSVYTDESNEIDIILERSGVTLEPSGISPGPWGARKANEEQLKGKHTLAPVSVAPQ